MERLYCTSLLLFPSASVGGQHPCMSYTFASAILNDFFWISWDRLCVDCDCYYIEHYILEWLSSPLNVCFIMDCYYVERYILAVPCCADRCGA